jgi:hypothetical protein
MAEDLPSLSTLVARIRELLTPRGEPSGSAPGGLSLEGLEQQARGLFLDLARRFGVVLERLGALGGREAEAEEEPGDLAHKFDLGRPAEQPPRAEHIPWGYGQDRVTAMVVDPDRLYVYWEVTDEGIERARGGLGPGGPDAWLNLRIYDVTGRIFDGTNAHGYFDQKVERTDRQWFFTIGKPGSTACVELGMKSFEGYFVRIARSGRADFPRKEPAPPGDAQWLTVRTTTGDVGPPGTGGPFSRGDAEAAALASRAESPDPAEVPDEETNRRWDWDDALEGAWTDAFHTLAWEGPVLRTAWEDGPFYSPVEAPAYVEERHTGTVTVHAEDGRMRVVYGPWQVVIRCVGARRERRVLATWEMHRSWLASGTLQGRVSPGGTAHPGASEGRWQASELRLGGASERYRVGASELSYRGASEILYAGASERRLRGASELRFRGASERLRGGASEARYPGASEGSPPRRPGK